MRAGARGRITSMAFVEAQPAELSTTEAADRLGVSAGTIRWAIRDGQLRARREEWGSWVISEADLERFAASRRPRPASRRTRQALPYNAMRILGALNSFDHDTADELAKVVDLHHSNVRKHLNHMAVRTPPLVRPNAVGAWSITPAGRRMVKKIEEEGISLAPESQVALRIVADDERAMEEIAT